MMPTAPHALPGRPADVSLLGPSAQESRLSLEDARAFARFFAPLTSAKPLADDTSGDVENTTASCQENGALTKADCQSDDDDRDAKSDIDRGGNFDGSKDKQSDNSILASIMASCTHREKSRIYRSSDSAGLPQRELQRLAYQLQDSALAGSPRVSVGMVLPELGEIRFDVEIEGKVVFIHAFVDNDRAASALALAVSSLRDKLEERNLILGRLDVTSPSPRDRIKEGGHGLP
jgi:hypothetical protein